MPEPLNGLALLQQYQAQDQARQLGNQQLQLAPLRQAAMLQQIQAQQQAMEQAPINQQLKLLALSRQMQGQQANQDFQRQRLGLMAQGLNKAQRQPVPSGYRVTPQGNLEAIPGGPADMKKQGQLNQDSAMLNDSISNMDRLASAANEIKNSPGLSKITGLMSAVPLVGGIATIPGTDAANVNAKLDNLKSQVGFSVLQNMRNNSKTGGALGQVSDVEEKLLQDNLAALSKAQSFDEFQRSLGKIIDYANSAKDRLRSAYNMKYQGVQPQPQMGGWSIKPIQ